jgi:hypothetical protein
MGHHLLLKENLLILIPLLLLKTLRVTFQEGVRFSIVDQPAQFLGETVHPCLEGLNNSNTNNKCQDNRDKAVTHSTCINNHLGSKHHLDFHNHFINFMILLSKLLNKDILFLNQLSELL